MTAEQSDTDARTRSHDRATSEDFTSHKDVSSMRDNFDYGRTKAPHTNQQGKMLCSHSECGHLVFDQKCQWRQVSPLQNSLQVVLTQPSKHMDKHDRPFKCNIAGCETLRGFTYSAGLARHVLEVHKMSGGREQFFCPIHDCNRHSRSGFKRKSNRDEHVRRVHQSKDMPANIHNLALRCETLEASLAKLQHTLDLLQARNHETRDENEPVMLKRKRGYGSEHPDSGNEDLYVGGRHLRQEIEEKNSRVHQLEQAVMAVRKTSFK